MSSLSLLLLCVSALAHGVLASDGGREDFHKAGFPTMALFTGIAFIGTCIFFGRKATYGGTSASRLSLIPNIIVGFLAVFMIFGPGYPGPRCTTIGLQMFFITSLGFYVWLSNHKATAQLLAAIVFYTINCLLGNVSIFSHDQPIWTVSYSTCLTYFVETDGFNRCDDSGYLQLVRTFGVFSIIVLCIQFFHLFLQLADKSPINVNIEGVSAAPFTGAVTQDAYQSSYAPPANAQAQNNNAGSNAQGYQTL